MVRLKADTTDEVDKFFVPRLGHKLPATSYQLR